MSVQLRPPRTELRYAWLGDVYVDLTANQLHADGREIRLTPKATAVLRELMLRQNVVVRRDDLLGLVWRDGFPTDDVLTHAIKELRRALGDDPRAPVLIETIPRVGYRLRASVRVVPTPEDMTLAPPDGIAANEVEPPLADTEREAGAPVSSLADDVAALVAAPQEPAGGAAADPEPEIATASAAAPPVARWTGRRPGIAAVLAAVVVAVVVVLAALAWRVRPSDGDAAAPAMVRRVPVHITPVAMTADLGSEYFSAISPDGSTVAYVSAGDATIDAALRVKGRDPAALSRELVAASAGRLVSHPMWSPDGTRIVYSDLGAGECLLRVVPASGGTPQTVGNCEPDLGDPVDWSPDARTLYLSLRRGNDGGGRGIATLDLETGEQKLLDYEPRAADEVDLNPRVSPDGRWIAFRRGSRPYSDLWVMPREGGRARPLAAFGAQLRGHAWFPDSQSLLVSSDHEGKQSLYQVPLSGDRVVPVGLHNAHFPSIARNAGFVSFHIELELVQMVAFDLQGDHVGAGRVVAPASRSDHLWSLSPSGQRLVFVSARSGSPQVWVHDFLQDTTVAYTDESGVMPEAPQWAPDEKGLLYVRRSLNQSRLMRIDLASGRQQALTPEDERVRFGSYSSDGSWVLFSSKHSGTWQVWRMRVDGSEREQLTRHGGVDPRSFAGDPHVYYTKLSLTGLYRLDPSTGAEEHVTALRAYVQPSNYQISGGELWMYTRDATSPRGELLHRPLEGGVAADARTRVYARFEYPGGYPWPLATLDPGRTRLVANMVMRDGTDVFVAPLPP